MSANLFYILEGNNGATYIYNTLNWRSLQFSLKFYKARTIKARILKHGLQCYLYILGLLLSQKLKSSKEINQYLQQVSKTNISFNLDDKCSILISSTKDKIIVHHHEDYFQKFAFSKSFFKVRNEAFIYKLIHDKIEYFQVSDFFDYKYDDENTFCSFKLSNSKVILENSKPLNLVLPLIEFFKLTQGNSITVEAYVNTLLNRLNTELCNQLPAKDKLISLKNKYTQIHIPLGLVHRDFKTWNIIKYEKLLIFDFEETIIDGPPLEDLFNYLIDPIIMNKNSEEICSFILNKLNVKLYKLYLNELNLKVDFNLFLNIYLINRILFLKADNKNNTSNKYIELYNHMNMK